MESPKIPKEYKLQKLISDIKSAEPQFLESKCSYEELLRKYNYILTKKAKDRLDKLYTYIINGIPVLLEGETGSSKTLSAEIICKYISEKKLNEKDKEEKSYIKYNLSAEVKISDLMQKLIGDKKCISGINIFDGPFFEAFKQGIPLILDEINLASQEVLQCIEDALDSKEINIDISGIGHVTQKMKQGFCLIATQNPNKDNYLNKRQYLSQSFLSHFQIIEFPSFEIEELEEIAKTLFKSFNNNEEGDEKDKDFISDLIAFHKYWTSLDEVKNDICCFTIREIAASVKAYIDENKKNAFKIVKVIYGSRYENKQKSELLKKLGEYKSFKEDYQNYNKNEVSFSIPKELKNIYKNKVLIEVLESSLFSLKKGRNIIIIGNEGTGRSQISRWIAKIYNSFNDNNYYHFICTEGTKCSDLIGYHIPSTEKELNQGETIMEWKEGFLTESIKEGKVVILDNLNEANSTVTERLNDLLDFKYDSKERKFNIPENPMEDFIKINDKFRIIGVCDIRHKYKMSPAFLNRFDIIVLEDQLEEMEYEEYKKLVKTLLNKEEEQTKVQSIMRLAFNQNFGDGSEDDEDEEEEDDKDITGVENSIKKDKDGNINNLNKRSLNNKSIEYLSKIFYNKNKNNSDLKEYSNRKEYYTIKDISRFCYSLKLILKNNNFEVISDNKLIDFIQELLFSEKDKISNDEIKAIILTLLKSKQLNNSNSQFIFKGNKTLEDFIAMIYGAFLVNLHLCIIGPTGVGKTTCAKFFAEILLGKNKYRLFPFHRNSKTKELYGDLNIKEGKIENYKGPLIECAENGNIFIADEMNLSSTSTMKSLIPILDPFLSKNINIPGINSQININKNFFFIACQNDLDNLGRNFVPENLQRKIRNIKYPNQVKKEIVNICVQKRFNEFEKNDECFTEENASFLGIFMIKYNKMINKYNYPLLKWSFRDIDKIIRRIKEHIKEDNYINFEYYHFIYFYLFSSIPDSVLNKIVKNDKKEDTPLKIVIHSLFVKVFKLDYENDNQLITSFFEIPKIDIENSLIKKGKLGIKIDELEKIIIKEQFENTMSNYYNDFFKLKLSSTNEPILLAGPSSYKTHLAKFYIFSETNYKGNLIYLNQKTNFEELLGGPIFMTNNSIKNFYFDMLCDITKSDYKDNKKEILEENDLNKFESFEKEINSKKSGSIISEIIDHILLKLKIIMQNKEKENPKIEFNPGSILESIIKCESIIFKNIHLVSTEVFERFNELFGTESILSLNEDIYGTFFPANSPDKIIDLKKININPNIIIIGTCPDNSFQSISESILSRFSIICVGEHENEEKKKIIKRYYKKSYSIPEKYFNNIISKFESNEIKDIKKIKSFFYIFSDMNKNNLDNLDSGKRDNQLENNFNYSLSHIKLNEENSEKQLFLKNENILEYKNNYIISKYSKLQIYLDEKPDMKELSRNIIYIPIFNELVDLIHFIICLQIPLILEGTHGQGKQTAINYVSNLLNYNVENIIITKSFSVKDLFKKTVINNTNKNNIELIDIETKLNEKLDEKKNDERKIIFVFHNINNAETDVLSKLSEIFNKKHYKTSNYCFIGLINIEESSIERDSYYYNYFSNSIYFKVNSSNIENIKRFISKENKIIYNSILNYYKDDLFKENNIFTLNDISKFIKVKNISNFDDSFLEDIIFKNKYLLYDKKRKNKDEEKIIKLNNTLDCDLEFKNISSNLMIKVNGKSFSIQSNNIFDDFEKEKNILSFEQKKCLIFLGLAVKSNTPCIIQGPTGVGKSHLVKLFAKILGKKLHIFELNKDFQISFLTKNFIYKQFGEEEIKDINTKFNKILKKNNDEINDAYYLEKKYREILKIKNIDEESKETLEEIKKNYNYIHRFEYCESEFLEAVKSGEWILFDGIENSPTFIAEKLSFLCGEKPELNLYEKNIEPIYPSSGFHLFITYNSERTINYNSIPNSLLDKCLIYNLKSFSQDLISISQINHGHLVNLHFCTDKNVLYEISSKLSKIHGIIKGKLIFNNKDNITERTIINYCSNLNSDSLPLNLKQNFYYYYFPSLRVEEKEKYIKIINDNIEIKGTIFKPLASDYNLECKEVLSMLNNLEGGNNIQFNFGVFLNYCLNIPFKYINNLKSSINEAIINLKNQKYQGIYLPLNIFIKYLDKIAKMLIKEKENLNDIQIKNNINFPYIRILKLIEQLDKNNLFSWECLDLLIEKPFIFDVIQKMYNLKNSDSLQEFFKIISEIEIPLLKDVLKIFPYKKFNGTSLSLINNILTYIVENTLENSVNFEVKINESNKFEFKFDKKKDDDINILLELKFNDKNELIISNKTSILIPLLKNENRYTMENFDVDQNFLNKFYLKLIELVCNAKNIKKKSQFKKIWEKATFFAETNELKSNDSSYDLSKLMKKNSNNVIINCWSILFLDIKSLSESFLLKFLKEEQKKIYYDIYFITCQLYNEIFDIKKDENKTIQKILNVSKEALKLFNETSILYNLSINKNYIINKELKSANENKEIKKKINEELNIINDINNEILEIKSNPLLFYKDLMETELNRLTTIIDKIEIENYKERIIKRLELNFKSKKLIESLIKEINEQTSFEKLKSYEELIDNYIIKYNEKTSNKVKIFTKSSIPLEKIDNKNVILAEILLKYSEIRELIEKIKKDHNTKLISLKKLYDLTNESYAELNNSILFQSIKNSKEIENKEINTIIEATINSMLIKEIYDKDLIDYFVAFPNLINNLYNNNCGVFENNWCWNIEKKYNFDTKIYTPKLSNLSFLFLFIRIKDLDSFNKIKGPLIEDDDDLFTLFKFSYDKLNEIKDKNEFILTIGNILYIHSLTEKEKEKEKKRNNLEDLYQSIEKKINCENSKKKFLETFIKLKNLYFNYKNEELIFDDLENNNKFFSNKYPSLINFLNLNEDIYFKLINQPSVNSFKPNSQENQYIPLWLLCLRILSNYDNITADFKVNNEDILKFEKDLINNIKIKIKDSNGKWNNLEWLLLIMPNTINLINNEYSERFYQFFSYLLKESINFSEKNKNELIKIIKDYISKIFEDTYKNGINNIISKEDIFEIIDALKSKIENLNKTRFEKFIRGDIVTFFKMSIENALNKSHKSSLINLEKNLKENINKFEQKYNEKLKKKKIDSKYKEYQIFNRCCDKFKNNFINIKNRQLSVGNKSLRDKIIIENFKGFDEKKIEIRLIKKNEFLQKYLNENEIKKEEITFNNKINKNIFFSQFNNLIETLKKLNIEFKHLKIENVKKDIIILEQFRNLLKIRINDFNIDINEKKLFEETTNEINIDLNKDLQLILSKIKDIIDKINLTIEEYSKFSESINDKLILKEIEKDIFIYIPQKKDYNLFEENCDELIINNNINLIPYYYLNNNKIEGNNEIEYDLGVFNLYDLEYQNIYFASFDDNINFKLKKENEGIRLIKKNKLYFLEIKIPNKKEEKLESIKKTGIIDISYKNIFKQVQYNINFKIEALKIYLECIEYKMKYEGNNLFSLCTDYLFEDEIINFIIINNSINSKIKNYISLQSFKNNNCMKPEKSGKENGFSLKIKANNNENNNKTLSFRINIDIGRFKFFIKIHAQIKIFNYDFKVKYEGKNGYINNQLYCPINTENFELFINTHQNREFEFSIDYEDKDNNIRSIKWENKGVLFNTKKIEFKIQLKESKISNIIFISNINGIEKRVSVTFGVDKQQNFTPENIENKTDDSNFFGFYLNELNAQGTEKIKCPKLQEATKSKIIIKSEDLKLSKIKFEEIQIPKKNIKDILFFYNRILELSILFPIYWNSNINIKGNRDVFTSNMIDLKNEKQKLISHYYLLMKIYEEISKNKNYYFHNFLSKEINDFIQSFESLKKYVEFKNLNEEESNNKSILSELKENEVLNKDYNGKKKSKSKSKKRSNKNNKYEFNGQKELKNNNDEQKLNLENSLESESSEEIKSDHIEEEEHKVNDEILEKFFDDDEIKIINDLNNKENLHQKIKITNKDEEESSDGDIWKENDNELIYENKNEDMINLPDDLKDKIGKFILDNDFINMANTAKEIKEDKLYILERDNKLLNNEKKKENVIDSFLYIPNKDILSDQKHEFEKDIKNYIDEEQNNIDNDRKEIIQLVKIEPKQINYIKKNKIIGTKTNDNFEEQEQNYNEVSFNIKNFFNEYDKQLISKIIQKISEGIEDENLEISTQFPYKPNSLSNRNNNDNNEEYITKDLIKISRRFMEKCLEKISKSHVDFSKIAFCFILDCSLYLGMENKLNILMIVLSIIKIIEMMNIKFSILLTADDFFKVIIKDYEEEIYYNKLIEIIYETLTIKRYRNNILKSVKTAVDYMKCKDKENNIFLIFPDCVDDSILHKNYWKNNIMVNPTNAFIFFIDKKDSHLNKEQQDIICKMWNDFEKMNENDNLKLIDISLFNQKLNKMNLFEELFEFIDKIKIDNEKPNIESKKKLTSKNIINYEYFNEIIKCNNYEKFTEIYFIDNPKLYKINNNKEKKKIKEYKFNVFYNKKEINEVKSHTSQILKTYLDKTLIESIFYPNKATQKQLSTKGTEIDIMSLILWTIHPIQEPMIYLEDKGGLIRDYSITVIIDNSKTCFSEFNYKHSYLTIINLLKIIKAMGISSFDLIVTNSYNQEPHILIFDKSSILIFKDDAIYEKLLKLLSNPIFNSDLADSIHLAYELRRKKYEKESYLFILSDGLSHNNKKDEIIYYSNLCQSNGIRVFGIGLGVFPYKMQELFGVFIYSVNPENLLKALGKIFGKMIKTENELKFVSETEEINKRKNNEILNNLINNKSFAFQNLREELENIRQGDDVLDLFCNKEKMTYDKTKMRSFNNEKGVNLEIYSKNILKTQKILIVMLWSYELNKKEESPYIDPKYINEPNTENGVCIKNCFDHFGIDDYVVVDYENAIKELLKKNQNGQCNYYSVWILCGPKYPILPPINGVENKTNPYLVEEFINVLISFWKNGGSLIFLAEGDPLNFQVNLFLEKIEFPNSKKPNFRIAGNYLGDKVLEQDKTGVMNKNGVFDKCYKKSIYKGKEIQRQSLSHNLGLIYEGYSISFAVDKDNNRKITIKEKSELEPFKPFSINSEGGISALIYEADNEGRGDIIIDCGYTKCFLNLYKTGTFRFIQNIAGWTARPEINYMIENINPWEWRPKGIDYKVNYNSKYNGYLNIENFQVEEMKTLFAIDGSCSTEDLFYENELKYLMNKYYRQDRGDIIYRWGYKIEKYSTKDKLFDDINNKYLGGTSPYLIADIINKENNNNLRHLIIITDGCVTDRDIEKADSSMNKIEFNYEYVTVFIIGSGNLSIGAPFCRKIPNKTYNKKNEFSDYKELATLSKEDIKTLDDLEKYDNYNDFIKDYNKIVNAVQAKCIGTSGNKEIENKLDLISKKISNRIKLEEKSIFEPKINILLSMTRGSLLKAFTLEKISAATKNYKQ